MNKLFFTRRSLSPQQRKGTIVVLAAFLIVVLFAFVAFMVDLGYIYTVKSELQNGADAAVTAAMIELRPARLTVAERKLNASTEAIRFAELSEPTYGSVLLSSDVTYGVWDSDSKTLVPTDFEPSAVQLRVRRSTDNDNALALFFGAAIGQGTVNVSSTVTGVLDVAFVFPLALRGPGFGEIDADFTAANPGNDGPSTPANGANFVTGETVILHIAEWGSIEPTHLILDIWEPADVNDVLDGTWPSVMQSTKDQYYVAYQGTGTDGNYDASLAIRLSQPWSSDLRNVMVPVVEEIDTTRHSGNDTLTGEVRVVGFVSVHLDSISTQTFVDPDNDPSTYTTSVLVGTVLEDQSLDLNERNGSMSLIK